MIAMDIGGEKFGLGGIESKTELRVDGLEKCFRRPAVFEEKIFQAGAFAALAEDIAGAKDFGDGANHGNYLVWLDEGVEADR